MVYEFLCSHHLSAFIYISGCKEKLKVGHLWNLMCKELCCFFLPWLMVILGSQKYLPYIIYHQEAF